jgi:hypothetical protein
LAKEGIELAHVIGPKTGHSYHPAAKPEINRRIDANAGSNILQDRSRDLKFVTYTLRYNRCRWLTVDGLGRHWEQARVDADTNFDEKYQLTTRNVSALTVTMPPASFPPGGKHGPSVSIDGQPQEVAKVQSDGSFVSRYRKVGAKWRRVTSPEPDGLAKTPGLQGPIDDAFLDAFVMVKPTGTPLNEAVGKWVDGEMKHAVDHWRKQFRGDARVIADTAELPDANLVLWGDPSSNAVLAKIIDKLPVKWTANVVMLGDTPYPAGTHVPVLIYPNPLNPKRYVVLNSGFTFREYDYLNNARQVPKLPDYAVVDVTTPPNSRSPGKVVRAGFFGEKWELLPNDGK